MYSYLRTSKHVACISTWARLGKKLLHDLHMVDVSISTIKRQRARLGWRFAKPNYAQMVRNVIHEKRLLFCQSLMEQGHVVETFNNVIFTDETTIQFHQNCTISFCKIQEQQPCKMRPKHPANYTFGQGFHEEEPVIFWSSREIWTQSFTKHS